jgi:transcriptional regulator with PAS, ATPase and Fis domain
MSWLTVEGEKLRSGVREALRGVPLAAPQPGAVPAARIVSTALGDEPPSPRGHGPWLWLCAGPLRPAAVAEATLRGAYDCISLRDGGASERLQERARELLALAGAPLAAAPPGLVAQSPAAKRMVAQLTLAARTSQPVLLTGETGAGKELAARLVHELSARSKGRFVPINCAAIPNDLMEGQLFGYAKGAFSGAVRAYDGLVSAGQGGTVFLDEIDDTPHALQVKLLRVLEDRVVNRLGENEWRTVDFRLVAATNRDLRELVAQGSFGADLYERLAVLQIQLPPLRERLEDLPVLLTHLIDRFYREEPSVKGRVRGATPEAVRALQAYPWPGNIRELRNVVFAVLSSKRAGEQILLSDLPRHVLRREPKGGEAEAKALPAALQAAMDQGSFSLRHEVEALERAAVQAALQRSSGNVARAARLLGEVGRGKASDPGSTLRAMMKRLGVPRS